MRKIRLEKENIHVLQESYGPHSFLIKKNKRGEEENKTKSMNGHRTKLALTLNLLEQRQKYTIKYLVLPQIRKSDRNQTLSIIIQQCLIIHTFRIIIQHLNMPN